MSRDLRNADLDEWAEGRFAGIVNRIISHFMIVTLITLAMLGGSGLPMLHLHEHSIAHAHDANGTSEAKSATGDTDVGYFSHTHNGVQHDNHPSPDRDCMHVHAHCCVATALLASTSFLPPSADPAQARLERNGALPYGQLPYPPLRPPRLTA